MAHKPISLFLFIFVLFTHLANAEDKTVDLEKIEVTGSHIKRVDTEGPSPVIVINREEIEKSGASTMSDLLRKLTLTNGVSFNENNFNSEAPGSSGINLRGLGQNATLVLINGRRMANYGFAQGVTETFVDLNSIPLGAIERIEIQKDGASATYGSDAIAGVVNVILRKNYTGTEATAGYGVSSEGDAEETTVNAVTGTNIGDGNLTFVFDYYNRDGFKLGDREFSSSNDYSARTSEGGQDFGSIANPSTNVLDPATGAPLKPVSLYNFNPDITAVPDVERISALLSFNHSLGSNLDFFSELQIGQLTTENQLPGTPFGEFIPSAQAFNTFGQDVIAIWRLDDIGKRKFEVETDVYRLVAGIEGVAGEWDWDAAVNLARSKTVENGKNFVLTQALGDALNNDTYNPFDITTNSAAVLDPIRTDIKRTGISELASIDAKASTEIAQLENGPVALAIGIDRRYESMSDKPDSQTEQGLVWARGGTSVDGDRTSTSLFAEVNLPLAEDLEMQLAARYEDYSDFGNTTNPKVALRYQPTNNFLLRTSIGTGFRAPSLAELYIGPTLDFPFLIDTTRCNATGTLGCGDEQYATNLVGNPDLDAEESQSFYLGGVYEPVTNFVIGLDYWRYEHTNRIDNNAQFILDNESNFLGQVTRDAGASTGPGDPGPIVSIDADFFNVAEQETDGIDLSLKYMWKAGGAGTFTIQEVLSRLLSFDRKTSEDQPFEDLAGTYRFPELKSTTSFAWALNDFGASLTANYLGGYEDSLFGRINPSTGNIDTHKVDSLLTFDAQFFYRVIKSGTLTVGINNLTDEEPPFANGEIEGYDVAHHNPIGRFYYLRYKHEFK